MGDNEENKINGGLRVEVTLIGGQKIEFSIGARLLTEELVGLVASHYAIRDCRFFSLAYVDLSGHYHWLQENLRLLDHDFARGVRVLPLHFSVKFFPENIADVHDAQAVELFYRYAKEEFIKGELEAEEAISFKLSALILHASHGEYLDKYSVETLVKKGSLIPPYLNNNSVSHCQKQVYEQYCLLHCLNRGEAIIQFLKEIERIPSYGVHLYEVKDRTNVSTLLGITLKGILEYEDLNKKNLVVRKHFTWKQLENLYLRERKFSIEVLDSKRASLTKRTFAPSNIVVYVWCAESQAVCKTIWSMAIAQHQFYLESKSSKTKEFGENPDLAGELSKSCLSLSGVSCASISRSGSHSSLHHSTEKSESSESLQAARMELLMALQQRFDSLQDKLQSKTEELRMLCIKEGELTGELPKEYPVKPGEPPPVVRKRVGTSFSIEQTTISKIINKQEETVAGLEVELEIQAKITSAILKLTNDSSSKKGLRRTRKHSYQLSLQKLKDIERKLKVAKSRQTTLATDSSTMPKMKKKPRPALDPEGAQDDSYLSVSSSSLPSREYKETSFMDSSVASSHGSYTPGPTPHRLSTHSDSSYNPQELTPRPVSGYIPSCVYTRNQYRAQHYPTLSTRGQSVPLDSPSNGLPTFNRAVFNVPQQRQSIVSHSLDDLEASLCQSPLAYPINHRVGTPDRVLMEPQRSGRLESRSMEHLNETPCPKTTHESYLPQPILPPRDTVDRGLSKRRSHSVVAPSHIYLAQESRLSGKESPVHRLVRTSSGRSYMETTFDNCINQENIPPKATEHKYFPETPRSSSDYRIPATELPPLRVTKVPLKLPPQESTPRLNYSVNAHITPLSNQTPLLSLAEAARLKKDVTKFTANLDHIDRPITPQERFGGPGKVPAPPNALHNVSVSSIGSNCSIQGTNDSDLNNTSTIDSPSMHMVITSGTFQPSREVSKPFEMADFYKYSTKFRPSTTSDVSDRVSPNQHSPPVPQQKGIYQPLSPMTCQPLSTGSSDRSSNSSGSTSNPEIVRTWELTPVHQAVPATVTNKRSATLV